MGRKLKIYENRTIILSILLITIILVYSLQNYFSIKNNFDYGDFIDHLTFAKLMQSSLSNSFQEVPKHILVHSFYHNIVNIFYSIFGINYFIIGVYVVPIFFRVILSFYLFRFFSDEILLNSRYLIAFLLTISILFISPIAIFTYPKMYLGYISINSYHSPTQILALCISVILFINFSKLFFEIEVKIKDYFKLFILLFISAFSKPSYLICIVPAIIVFYVILLKKGEYVNIKVVVLTVFFALLILSFQYYLTYSHSSEINAKSVIAFKPFKLVRINTPLWLIIPKFILSILFPLVTYLFFYKKSRTDHYFNLSWVIFLFSIIYFYFLIEKGPRAGHGNFGWGAQISLFLLFLVAVRFLISNFSEFWVTRQRRLKIAACIFGIHFFCGVVYYWIVLNGSIYG